MEVYRQLYRRLEAVYEPMEAQAVARCVMEDVFSLGLADLLVGKDNALPPPDRARLEKIAQRLLAGEPVQYVVGYATFMGRRFEVTPAVLIPRPETEGLVAATAPPPPKGGRANEGSKSALPPLGGGGAAVLDVGTGSGCIAVSVALLHPDWDVEAWDISPEALAVARRNAERLGARVRFMRRDVLAAEPAPEAAYDVIVSNPPYICRGEAAEMEARVVCYEPDEALFVPDDDPLRFYRAIGRMGLHSLRKGGRLLFETNTLYAHDVARMLDEMGYFGVSVSRDVYERERYVEAHTNDM